MRVPPWASAPPPCAALARVAPLLSASASSSCRYAGFLGSPYLPISPYISLYLAISRYIRSSCRYAGFLGSGSGVIVTPLSHGSPCASWPTAAASLLTKASAMLSCTRMSLIAVHLVRARARLGVRVRVRVLGGGACRPCTSGRCSSLRPARTARRRRRGRRRPSRCRSCSPRAVGRCAAGAARGAP